MICLIDRQDAYLGDIGKERFPISQGSVEKIIDRMDVYIQDSVIDEFETALEDKDIDTSTMSLSEMISKCKELDIGEGEVCYALAEAVNNPANIYIKEVLQMQNTMPENKQSLTDKIHAAETKIIETHSDQTPKDKRPGQIR